MALKISLPFTLPNNGGHPGVRACQPPAAPGDKETPPPTQLKLDSKTQLKLNRPNFVKKLDNFSTTFKPIKTTNEIITSFKDYEGALPYLVAAAKFLVLNARNKGFAARLKLIISKYGAKGLVCLLIAVAIYLSLNKEKSVKHVDEQNNNKPASN